MSDTTEVFDTFCGTPDFAPPEVVLTGKYRAESATVWTIGTLLYILLIGQVPYENNIQIISGKPQHSFGHLSQPAQNFISKCFNIHPKNRPLLKDLLKHPFLQL